MAPLFTTPPHPETLIAVVMCGGTANEVQHQQQLNPGDNYTSCSFFYCSEKDMKLEVKIHAVPHRYNLRRRKIESEETFPKHNILPLRDAGVKPTILPCCRVLLLTVTDLDAPEKELSGNYVVTLLKHGDSKPDLTPVIFCNADTKNVFSCYHGGVRVVGSDVRKVFLIIRGVQYASDDGKNHWHDRLFSLHVEGMLGAGKHVLSWRQFLHIRHHKSFGSGQWCTWLGMHHFSEHVQLLQIRSDINIVSSLSYETEQQWDKYTSRQAFVLQLGKHRSRKTKWRRKARRHRRMAFLAD
jgi:hypothetical protein